MSIVKSSSGRRTNLTLSMARNVITGVLSEYMFWKNHVVLLEQVFILANACCRTKDSQGLEARLFSGLGTVTRGTSALAHVPDQDR